MPKPVAPPVAPTADYTLFARSWRRHLDAANLSETTITIYTLAVKYFGDYLAAQGMPQQVAGITAEHIREWLAELRHRPHPRTGRPLKAATLATYYAGVREFFGWLADPDGAAELPASPCARVRPPKVPETPVPRITDADLQKLFASCKGARFTDRRDRAILALFFDAGLRRAELAGLQLAPVERALDAHRDEDRAVTVLAKGRREHTVHLARGVRAALNAYLLARAKHPHAADPALWLGTRGPLHGDGIYDLIRRRGVAVGLDIHPHLFRHEFAIHALSNGMQEGDVMEEGGWRDPKRMRKYAAANAGERARRAHSKYSPLDNL